MGLLQSTFSGEDFLPIVSGTFGLRPTVAATEFDLRRFEKNWAQNHSIMRHDFIRLKAILKKINLMTLCVFVLMQIEENLAENHGNIDAT